MKIVVFGSTGFVGRSLVTHLIEHNHSVILVNRSNHYHSHAKSIVVPSLFDSHLYHNELSSADAVIYLSGLAHIDSKLNSDDLNLYLSNNYYPLAFVSHLSGTVGIKRFIYFSSSKVLGEYSPFGTKFSNYSNPNPVGSYSLSKYYSENFLRHLSSQYSTDFVILRPPLIYGPNAKGNISSLLRLFALNIPLPLSSLTKNRRSMISLHNLNRFISCILSHPVPINSSLLISDNNDFSTVRFMKYIGTLYGKQPLLYPFPVFILSFLFRLFKPSYYYSLISSFELDISHTCALLNFKP